MYTVYSYPKILLNKRIILDSEYQKLVVENKHSFPGSDFFCQVFMEKVNYIDNKRLLVMFYCQEEYYFFSY